MHALAGVNVTFERGRFTAVMGPSGSGKSTLMHCMAGLDRPTSGQAFVGDLDLGTLDDSGLTQMRRDRVGFVFQSFNLVPTLTAGENITLPADLAGRRWTRNGSTTWCSSWASPTAWPTARQRCQAGSSSAAPAPGRSSTGRTSSSLTSPPATLTPIPRTRCWASCGARSTSCGQSIVMVTHDPHGASFADRVVFLADGQIVDELADPTADSVLERVRNLGA